jgi:hypothetical protein
MRTDRSSKSIVPVLWVDAQVTRSHAAQKLLSKLLAALGPITTNIMIEYLQNRPSILLADVSLLNMIATLLPNLSRRIITILVEVIDTIMSQRSDDGRLYFISSG